MRFTIEGAAAPAPATFKKESADQNPIAAALFRLDGVVSVFMVNDFVTVTKDPDTSWAELEPPARQAIEGV